VACQALRKASLSGAAISVLAAVDHLAPQDHFSELQFCELKDKVVVAAMAERLDKVVAAMASLSCQAAMASLSGAAISVLAAVDHLPPQDPQDQTCLPILQILRTPQKTWFSSLRQDYPCRRLASGQAALMGPRRGPRQTGAFQLLLWLVADYPTHSQPCLLGAEELLARPMATHHHQCFFDYRTGW